MHGPTICRSQSTEEGGVDNIVCNGFPIGIGSMSSKCETSEPCLGCDGIIDSGKVVDECGVCGGDNSTCTDCAGIVNGDAVVDAWRECGSIILHAQAAQTLLRATMMHLPQWTTNRARMLLDVTDVRKALLKLLQMPTLTMCVTMKTCVLEFAQVNQFRCSTMVIHMKPVKAHM